MLKLHLTFVKATALLTTQPEHDFIPKAEMLYLPLSKKQIYQALNEKQLKWTVYLKRERALLLKKTGKRELLITFYSKNTAKEMTKRNKIKKKKGRKIMKNLNKISKKEEELKEIQNQYLVEMAKIFKLSEKEIKFFLTRLQDGNILDDSYRKVLVDMLVNSILVYDNELVIICNVGNKPITLTIDLIEDIKSELVTEPFTFVKRFGSPKF